MKTNIVEIKREIRQLCKASERGQYCSPARIAVLFRKYPRLFSEISDQEHSLAMSEMMALGGMASAQQGHEDRPAKLPTARDESE